MDFHGNYVALVTPFKGGQIDWDALESLVQRQIEGGVSGLVPCGTTGESPTLSHEEHNEVISAVVKMASGQVPVIAGTGSNSTAEAIQSSRHAQDNGASALLIVAPYYNKPTQEGLFQHYMALANSVDLPIMVYNIPGRSAVEIDHDTIVRLAEHENIASVKEATGNILHVSELLAATDLAILSGDDALTLPMVALGASGVVSVASNLEPRRMSDLATKALGGDFAGAQAIHNELFPLLSTLLCLATNPIPIKTALALRGWMEEEFRLPLVPLGAEQKKLLAERLQALSPLS
jgi:4-hydroxy-tetrahydrodipicolinate synthase